MLRAAHGCLSRVWPPPLGCIMSNHFHLLVRVPHWPEGFDVSLEVVLARLEGAIGDEAMALVRTVLDFWTRSGLTEVIEAWRQRQVARMFNLSEFVRCAKLGFCLLRRLYGNHFAFFEPLTAVGSPVVTTGSMGGVAPFGRSGLGWWWKRKERCGRWRRILT